MKISLIENGIDSLEKGYAHLKRYEEAKESCAEDSKRFLILKDATLSIQHGAEILFKYVLRINNEILLYSDIGRLKEAYKKKHAGDISELFEAEGVHAISYRESIERIRDICNIPIDEKLKDNCLKIERWRNGITHSAVILNELEVASVLSKFMVQLDRFFSKAIGAPYVESPGKKDLDRAYSIFKALHGKHSNEVKQKAIERLIKALQENRIKGVTAPGVFRVSDFKKSVSILKSMQGDGVVYGFDMSNMHCSGKSVVEETGVDGVIQILGEDNNCIYQFSLLEMIIYIPEIEGDFSPLIFLYSEDLSPVGREPYIKEFDGTITQRGYIVEEVGEIWEKPACLEFMNDTDDSSSWISIERFLSKGCVCFMNIQHLGYGSAADLLHRQFPAQELFELFESFIAKKTE